MLDRKTERLLKILIVLTEDGTAYKVLAYADISEKLGTAPETLKELLTYLNEREYIKIKYNDAKDVCLTVLPKGKLYTESVKKDVKTVSKGRIKFFIATFLGAMAGGIVGSGITILVCVLFKLLS